MQNELEKRNLTATQFKKKCPRLYRKILDHYRNIFDVTAVLCLWIRGDPQPVCDICQAELTVCKDHRHLKTQLRCSKHAKATVVSAQEIHNANIHGYRLFDVKEINLSTDIITVECSDHGRYTCRASYFLKKFRCQKCYHEAKKGTQILSFEDWLIRSQTVHQSKYNYDNSVYTGTINNIEIECPIHGVFSQNAGVHMRGHGCRKCGDEYLKQNKTMLLDEFVQKASLVHKNKYDYRNAKYNGSRSKINIVCPIHGPFQQIAYYHLAGNGCQLCGKETTTYKSSAEYEIIDFLKSLGVKNIVHSWWGLNTELDIYLPDHNVAIEYNGIYWHSSISTDSDSYWATKHLKKTNLCEKNNIQLFHILDLEWLDEPKKAIWKSVLTHKLGLTKHKIHARNTKIELVNSAQASEFFTDNHLQGHAKSSVNAALTHDGQIVSIGSFGKSRFTKDKECWELIRFATKCGTLVSGGFSKILSAFSKEHPGKIISYANRRWSTGNLYSANGFVLDHISGPCYYYTDCETLWHRSVFQKHKLKDKLDNFDPTISEVQNMYKHKYRRIWDCGNLVFVKE